MTREYSAGGIVFRQPPTNNIQQTMWLVCQHSQHKGWVFPKGLIGDKLENESKEETALREVKEETGVEGKIVQQIPNEVKYWYQFKGEKIFKTVYFYLMEFVGGDIRKHDHEMMDVKWVTTDEVKNVLSYANDKKAFDEALKIFNKLT